jgi:glycosyltransferase involved in cell wall biosynthesis
LPDIEPIMLLPGPRATLPEMPPGEVVIEEPPARAAGGKARKLWWEQIGLPRATRRAGVDLVHVPYHSVPLRRDLPHLVTIHDLIPLVYPVYMNTRQMQVYYRLACYTAARADLILTDSDHSAGDLEHYLAIPRERVRAIPLAASDLYRPLPPDDPTIAAARAKFGITGPFVFNVGGLDVRKNLTTLIRAFALAQPQLPPGTQLVIAGAPHSAHPDRFPDLTLTIAACGLADVTVLTGRISDEEKLALLNAAELYAYPCLYDGFGISPLEAMRCGTPTISSDRSSLPEVVGEGGLLIEPTPEKFGAAIAFVMGTPHERRVLRRRALARADEFSWARTAQLTAAAYEETLYRARSTGRGRKRVVVGAR